MSLIAFSGFNDHWKLQGQHSFLSASKCNWLEYDEEKLLLSYKNSQLAELGTKLHNLAKELIELHVKLPNNGKTLSRYVNDAIGFGMKPEVVLFYSEVAFGTADTICFRQEMREGGPKWVLRIHDLKTGKSKPDPRQLMVYAAYFCLEYNANPRDIEMHLRIYYDNDVIFIEPSAEDILNICDLIREDTKILKEKGETV